VGAARDFSSVGPRSLDIGLTPLPVTTFSELLGMWKTLCSVLAAKDVEPPISIGSFRRLGEREDLLSLKRMAGEFDHIMAESKKANNQTAYCSNIVQLWFNAWHYV